MGAQVKQACYLRRQLTFLSFLGEALIPLAVSVFEFFHPSGLISTQLFCVCTCTWLYFIARPLLLFSNFNLVRAVLWFIMTLFWFSRLSLVLNPFLGDEIFFLNNNLFLAHVIYSCDIRPLVTASYSDSYSSDEDDVSPRERSQVCSQVYFSLNHNLLPVTLLFFASA